ncbi:RxLR effector protein [Phytophthora megakarya]|uniref:RxLR effector protein n=1 Tax=Phytophthora megakarya TaxID=4795 RepID=A0A225WLB2_9STRA|nr:RxLR effector protein [Phytophthora megakarya]
MRFLQIAKYFEKNNPQNLILKVLGQYYSDENLFKMLTEAKKNQITRTIATKLYAAKFQGWLDTNKTPKTIFTLLGLDKEIPIVLTKPLFLTYVEYVRVFNKKNPVEKVWLLDDVYNKHPIDYSLNKLVEEAMKYPNTEKASMIVTVDELKRRFVARIRPADTFSEFVRETKGGDNFFTSPNFKLWVKYIDDFNKKYPDDRTSMIDSIRYSYTDEELAKILMAGKSNSKTKELAANLELALVNTWSRELKTPDEVSKLMDMGLSTSSMKSYVEKYHWALYQGDKLFEDPRMWMQYVEHFRARFPASDESVITILTNRYGDDVVAKKIATAHEGSTLLSMRTAQLERWKSMEETPEDVFTLLKLDKGGTNLFDNTVLETWIDYVKLVTHKNIVEKVMFDIFARSYKNDIFSKIIIAGKGSSWASIASNFQKRQIYSWLKSKEELNDVYKWLMVKGTAKNNPERLLYKKYVQDYRKSIRKKKTA